MSNKKQVFISLDTAKEFYNSGSKAACKFALDNFTKEELEAKELPKSWNDLGEINGFYISDKSDVCVTNTIKMGYINRNIFPTKELAEASLALSQLLQLRDVYNGDWKVDLNNRPNESRYIIRNYCGLIDTLVIKNSINSILSFKSEDLRDQFAKNFENLITTALPLL